jgi:hypothetical protein
MILTSETFLDRKRAYQSTKGKAKCNEGPPESEGGYQAINKDHKLSPNAVWLTRTHTLGQRKVDSIYIYCYF